MRAQLDTILERAQSDESFGEQLNTQPEKTLREAGLDSRAVHEISREIKEFSAGKGSSKDFEAAMGKQPARMCDYTTCWISWCDHWGTFYTNN
ncbi:hypothetical protein DV701_15900 [Ornithinimicrobium avium]|uniref:Nif11 domain-containing protein n=2 Tax=Ornithinimicrobium avium TaxID=2283195 RepID=A0A345NQT7_9MICO|nr:hypothetical protein DV701_15900 [Ornithinimicrobium avium]